MQGRPGIVELHAVGTRDCRRSPLMRQISVNLQNKSA
jgi:hypothetical protein